MRDLHPINHKASGVYHLVLAVLYVGGVWYHFFGGLAHFREHKGRK